MPIDQRYRKAERLVHVREYERVHGRKCRVRGNWLSVAACENGLAHPRLGLAVGRRWGPAHDRVKLKRWFREAFRQTKAELPPGVDLVLSPANLEGMTLAGLKQELPTIAQKLARRLKASRIADDGHRPADARSAAPPPTG